MALLKEDLETSGIKPEFNPMDSSPEYRIQLALSLFYKFVLTCNLNNSKSIKSTYKSVVDPVKDIRSLSHSKQTYETKNQLFPLTQPIPKLNAHSQTTGETKYVDDLSPLSLQLNGAFILTKIANAKIVSINLEKASKVPGVVKILLAKDIPGVNNIMFTPMLSEPLFAEEEVLYAGQPVGLVVANTHEQAKFAASLVEINYKDVKKPILTIKEVNITKKQIISVAFTVPLSICSSPLLK